MRRSKVTELLDSLIFLVKSNSALFLFLSRQDPLSIRHLGPKTSTSLVSAPRYLRYTSSSFLASDIVN